MPNHQENKGVESLPPRLRHSFPGTQLTLRESIINRRRVLLQTQATKTLKPNFSAIRAAYEKMLKDFHLLGTKSTKPMVVETTTLEALRRPHPLMHQQPNEHLALIRGVNLPKLFRLQVVDCPRNNAS
jgi:hypothetical protein